MKWTYRDLLSTTSWHYCFFLTHGPKDTSVWAGVVVVRTTTPTDPTSQTKPY